MQFHKKQEAKNIESKELKTVMCLKLVICMKSSDRRQIDKQLDGRNESYYSLFM
jgi:hypothetical protein